jgi:hypothetical protein
MELLAQEKDKQNRPIAVVDISTQEVDAVRLAVAAHPKFVDPDSEGMRFRALLNKESLRKLTNINLKDIKEAVNRYLQTHDQPDEPMDVLYDDLHQIWKVLNPS